MPRQPRLDAPSTLHHVMVRGLERRAIFRDDTDRADFVTRLAGLAEARALAVYAWALLPNHAHVLVRTGRRPLARSMRSLLTGCAGAFNRRHHRVGHLFQGGGEFVERVWREAQETRPPLPSHPPLESIIARVCRQAGTTPDELAGGSRRPAVTRAREGIAHLWVGALGGSGRRLAPALGVAPQSVYRAAVRGAARAAEWAPFLKR